MMRCPAVQGLPDEVYHILHHSFVEILKMCRSIEIAEARIDESMMAVIESCDVLKACETTVSERQEGQGDTVTPRVCPSSASSSPAAQCAPRKCPPVTVGLHEVKFDGYRVQVHKVGSGVVIYSRNGHDFTEPFSSSRICCTSSQPKRLCSIARLSPSMLMGVQTSPDLHMRWPLTRKRLRRSLHGTALCYPVGMAITG